MSQIPSCGDTMLTPRPPLAPLDEFPAANVESHMRFVNSEWSDELEATLKRRQLRPLIQLSAANVAPTAKSAYEAIQEWQQSLHLYGAAEFNDDQEEIAFEPLRKATAKLLNCKEGEVCGGTSCSELLGSVAWGLVARLMLTKEDPNRKNVIGTQSCFPSTFYAWTRVCEFADTEIRLISFDENKVTSEEDIISAMDSNTRVVALSHVEFTSGQVYNLGRIAQKLHEITNDRGSLIVDGSQSVGMLPIDIEKETDPSGTYGGHYARCIAVTGYKWLCGSFGSGLMWCSQKKLLESYNGCSVSSSSPENQIRNKEGNLKRIFSPGLVGFRSHYDMWACNPTKMEYPLGAKRFEFATMHFGAALGLAKCVELLNLVGTYKIFKHNLYLANYLIRKLEVAGLSPTRCEVIWPTLEARAKEQDREKEGGANGEGVLRSSIVSLRLKGGKESGEVEHILKEEHRIVVTKRGIFLRVSPHYYNGTADLDKLVEALGKVL
jgi:cysteine desulfurase/selenocysteine lyase